ncbi:MAG: hypothetical protein JWQ43_2711 [Glaciihabitans sp.]|nr:hypothetical protein [Glaciihabitans sp.]
MNATGLPVPNDVVASLGSTKNPAVKVTIRRDGTDYSYASSIASRGGSYLISLSAAHRTATGIAAGDELEVTLELDTSTRTIDVPADLADALGAAGALEAFNALSYSKQRGLVEPIEAAKTPETRERRIEKAVLSCAA